MPRGAEAGCFMTTGAGLAVSGSAGTFWGLYRLLFTKQVSVIALAIGGVALVAALIGFGALVRGVYVMLASSRTPEPELRIDRNEVRPGDSVELLLTLPGPADLEELFLTLRCDRSVLVTTVEPVTDQNLVPNYGKTTVRTSEWKSSVESIISILREEHVRVRRGERFERQLFFTMPDDAPRSVSEKDLRLEWTFEVEARPENWANAIDEFPIRVV